MPETPSEDVKEEHVEEVQPDISKKKETKKLPLEDSSKDEESTEEEKNTETKKQPSDPAEKTQSKPSESKKQPAKQEEKKKQHKDDFRYIVRLANTDIDGEKTLIQGLTTIKGVGMHMSVLITDKTNISRGTKMGDLTDAQIEKIQQALDSIVDDAPAWMLNHRKDAESGTNVHLIGPDIDMRLRDEVNIMKKIRSYRGIRHERGLPVRGQRTRANNRRGLALGVSKKREQQSKT